jgi:hypothetical protein
MALHLTAQDSNPRLFLGRRRRTQPQRLARDGVSDRELEPADLFCIEKNLADESKSGERDRNALPRTFCG